MDIEKIERTYPQLIAQMKSLNMGRVACMAIEPMVRRLVEYKGQYMSYPDFFAKFIDAEGIDGRTKRLSYYRTTLRRIWAFDEYNHLPDRKKFEPVLSQEHTYDILNDAFRKIVDDYDEKVKSKVLSSHTISVDKNIAIHFFASMQKHGADTIDDITPQMMTGYFIKDGEYVRGNDIASKLKKVLHNYTTEYPYINDILKYVPMRKDVVHIQEVLPDEDIAYAKSKLFDESLGIGLRNRTIVAIVLYTGLRGSDVAKLTIDNIDWTNDRIKLLQSKTQQLLTLPLHPVVGNIIYEYIVKEWPKENGSRKLFFKTKRNDELEFADVGCAVGTYFGRLGLTHARVRAIRHYIASKLLEVGTEPAIISSILGHTNPETINHYLDMDIEDLRSCGLDISIFPLDLDIFK